MIIAALIISLLVLGACSDKKKTTEPTEDTGIVSGIVNAYGRSPLAGAKVSIGSHITFSDAQGKFVLLDIPEGEHIRIDFSKEGYAGNQKVIRVEKGKTTYIDTTLRMPLSMSFASTAGVTLTDSFSSITIPENAIESPSGAFVGNVMAEYRYFDPTNMNNLNAFPGEFAGIQTDGTPTIFESYGFVYVSLSSAQDPQLKLQLAQGKKAAIRGYIPNSLQANAPDTMPMWFYDESKGQWYEEGFATRNGNYYETEVSHFSYWNFDDPIAVTDQSTLTGRVVYSDSKSAVPNAQVIATGINYSGYTKAYTDAQGRFSISVKASSSVNLWAYSGMNSSHTLGPINTPGSGGTLDVGDISVYDKSFTLVGKLVNASGQAITDGHARVGQLDIPAGDLPLDTWFSTEDDGTFNIQMIYEGSLSSVSLQFQISTDLELYSQTITLAIPSPGQVINLGNIIMQEGGKIKGRAKDHLGNWLPNEWIYFMKQDGEGESDYFPTQSDENGYFIITGPPNRSINNVVGNIYKEDANLESAPRTLNFPASGKTTDIGTVVFSPSAPR